MSGQNESYAWKDYTATVMGRTMVGIDSLDYDFEKKVEAHYGKGEKPIGWGSGNKKASGKMTITEDEYAVLQKAAQSVGCEDVTDLPPFPIVGILAKTTGEKFKQILPAVKITKVSAKKKQDDTKLTRDLDFICLVMPFEKPM